MSTAETLLEAAGMIRARGWCQGEFFDADGRVCAMGAIHRAAGWHEALIVAAERHLRSVVGRDVPGWNDAGGRKADEVIAALEKAASLADQESIKA